MPFGVVRGVGRGTGVLDGGGDRRRGRGSFGVNFGRTIVTNGAFATRSSQITLRTCIDSERRAKNVATAANSRRVRVSAA